MAKYLFKCSDEELARYRDEAKQAGLSLAVYIRSRLNQDQPSVSGQPAETFTQLRAKLPKPAPRKPGSMCRRCTTIGKPSCGDCRAEANKASASATEVFSHLEPSQRD